MDLRAGVDLLRRAFPDLDVREEPWPHIVLDDAVVEVLGKVERRWWLRTKIDRPEEVVKRVPGAVRIGIREICWPMFGGPGGLNRLKRACPRGHALTGANVYLYRGRRYCRACR